MDVLNVGCGLKPIQKEGWRVVNHDRRKHHDYVDVTWDLNEIPWPWEDDSFDRIFAIAVFEHLRINLFESVGECWRLLKPEGFLRIKLPYWQSDTAWLDPSHYWKFSVRSLDQFDPDTRYGNDYSFYMDRKWKIVKPARLNNAGTSFTAVMQVRK